MNTPSMLTLRIWAVRTNVQIKEGDGAWMGKTSGWSLWTEISRVWKETQKEFTKGNERKIAYYWRKRGWSWEEVKTCDQERVRVLRESKGITLKRYRKVFRVPS